MKKIIELNSNMSNLDFSWLKERLDSCGYDLETVNKTMQAIEEILKDIIKHSRAKTIVLNYACHPHKIKLHLADEGKRFNPLKNYKTKADENFENKKNERFGLKTAKTISEEFFHKRLGIYNISTLAIKVNTINRELITGRRVKLPGGIIKFII